MLAKLIEPRKALDPERQSFSNTMLRAMIIPLLIEQLLQMIVGIADTMMVSYAGEATVSGVSLDTMIYTIFIYLFTAVATGGAVPQQAAGCHLCPASGAKVQQRHAQAHPERGRSERH